MKSRFLLAAIPFILSSAVYAAADTAKLRIGFVDLRKALESVEAGKTAKASLEKQAASKKAELEKQQSDLQKEAEQFEKKSAIMNESAKAARQAELQKKIMDFQKSAQESQMDLQKKERDLTVPIVNDLKSIVEAIGKEKAYQLIVEKSEGAILYAENGSDLTEVVIERFNAKNKKGKRS